MQWLAVAMGGALGAVGRYGINALVYSLMGTRFPLGTLVVNVLGSLLMGVFYVLIVERQMLPGPWREFIMIGLLGAFTTFSAFSLDILSLWEGGHVALALIYVLASVVLCVIAALAAIALTRLF
ncbi:MAG TPA: fluoride efflux transporter CrcB [Porticoccaceae bacterium]|nr:fluoride efflux transporter CrcB [Porticoccaceae bacterium]HCO61653.1 fluoride efflux transporter CrcB [Porticoccaceae bacterium]